jgi:MoaA/NifB/PqqE/SkfB family radical SAM enzyme
MRGSRKAFSYNIDVVGGCNLRCPSCPVGSMRESGTPKTLMSPQVFEEIVLKIKRETPGTTQVNLYNWTEPLLHPELPRLLSVARGHGLPVALSCNFNTCRNLEAVLAEEPMSFRISVSGFFQETYERTHRNGDIAKVKANMRLLRETMDRLDSATQVQVAYHCYVDNLAEDYTRMRDFCASLGFFFLPMWAYVTSIEKLLDVYECRELGQQDRALLSLLAVSPREAREIARRRPSGDCVLRSHQTTINSDGSVALCCGVYDRKANIARHFLDVGFEGLQTAKYEHPLCGRCMSHGIHDLLTYTDFASWNRVAAARISPRELPPELHRMGWFFSLQRRVEGIVGHSAWDRLVHLLRARLMKRRRVAASAGRAPVELDS